MSYKAIYDEVHQTGLPNYLEAKVPVPSGLNINEWRVSLADFPDVSLVDHLEFGWPLDFTANSPPFPTLDNHFKDPADMAIIKFVGKEVRLRARLGPFTGAPFEPCFQWSPMMTRPKKNTTEKHIITDLSYPKGHDVNAGIKKGFYLGKAFNFSLPTIATLTDRLLIAGCWFMVLDS